MDKSGYQVCHREDMDFHCEEPDLNMDATLRPGIDTPFTPSKFNDFAIVSTADIQF